MSRTTRTLPRWVYKQIREANNLKNGYREATRWDEFVWRGKNDGQRNEHNAWFVASDNAHRPLYKCKKHVGIGKRTCSWSMAEATTQIAKAYYRKLWARNNRRLAKRIIEDELNDMHDEHPLHWPLFGGVDDNSDDYIDEEYYVDDYDDDIYDPAAMYQRGYREGYSRGVAEGYMKALAEFDSIPNQRSA